MNNAVHAWRLRPAGNRKEVQPVSRDIARRALGLARPYRGKLIAYVVALTLTAGLGVLPPLIIGRGIIDNAIPQNDLRLLTLLSLAGVAVGVLTALLSLFIRYLSASIGEGLILDLRTLLFGHVQSLSLSFFTRTQTGALITRLNNDVIGAQRALTGTLGGIVDNSISVIATLIAMAALDWRVTLIALGLLPLFLFPARAVGQKLQGLSREAMTQRAEMNTTMTERFNVSGAMLVKLFGQHERESSEFHARASRVAQIGVREAMLMRSLFVSLGLIGTLATVVVYYVGGRFVIESDTLQVGTLVSMALLVTNIYGPLAQLSNARVDFLTAMVSFERVFEVVDLRPLVTTPDTPGNDTIAHGSVTFDSVHFAYPGKTSETLATLESPGQAQEENPAPVLHGISFQTPAGSTTAIVGSSGAGKSTLVSLLPRLYDVTDGAVTIDGTDIRHLPLDTLRSAIGVVTQDAHLFHDTIANNLRYARHDATDAELVAALEAAHLGGLYATLPEGLDTIVGERGYRLSGGEKQRIAIARVILKDPTIVVLDEATAHLDSESERVVQAALRDMLTGRTSLVIAHRLSTVLDADEIIVLEQGKIVERGTHEELSAKGGRYAELAQTQLA